MKKEKTNSFIELTFDWQKLNCEPQNTKHVTTEQIFFSL